MNARKPWLLLGAATAALLAAQAHAESYSTSSSAGAAARQAGGGSASALDRAIPTGVSLSPEVTYDTNVARGRTSIGNVPLTPEDEIFKPQAIVNVTKALGRETVFLQGQFGYDFYRKNTVLNSERILTEAGVHAPVGPCTMTPSGAFQRFKTDIADQDIAESNYETHETGSLQGDCSQTIGFAPEFTVSYGGVQNSTALRSKIDRNLLSTEGGVSYNQPTLGQITLYGDYEDASFYNLFIPVNGANVQDGYKVYAGGVRYTRRLGARIQGEAQLSYERLEPTLPGEPGFSGLTYSLDLTYQASGKLQSHLIFSRENNPSNRTGSTFSTDDVYSANVTYTMSGRLKLDLGGEYKDRNYGDLNAIVGTPVAHETDKKAQGVLTYEMSQRFEWALTYEYVQRSANITKFDYTSNRVTLRLNVKLL